MISAGTAAFITWPYVLNVTFKLRSPHFFPAVFSSLTSSTWSSLPSNSAIHPGRGDPETRWGPSVQGGVSLSVQEVALAAVSGKEDPDSALLASEEAGHTLKHHESSASTLNERWEPLSYMALQQEEVSQEP